MIRIISDSTSDLSASLKARYDITVLPLNVHLGENTYLDGVNVTPQEIFAWSDANNTTPKTSAVSLETAAALFKSFPDDELICFTISEDMSSTANALRLAAESIGRKDSIHIVNCANLSTGSGLLVVEAAEMAQQGKSSEEILAAINALIPRVRASFVVDTLTYLHRGGRCSSVAALAGGMLHLHPKIVVENGKMHATKKYRGKLKAVILSYVKDMEEDLKKAKKDRVFITHSYCDEAIVAEVRAYLEDLGVFAEIHETLAGGVICSHCGPGTLGVLFIEG